MRTSIYLGEDGGPRSKSSLRVIDPDALPIGDGVQPKQGLLHYLTTPEVPKHKELTCPLIASLGGPYQGIHYRAVLVRFGARLLFNNRLHA